MSEEPVSAMFVTAPSTEEAQRIAQLLLERRLVACVNMLPQVQSMYLWQGKLETAQEVLMMIKVRKSLFPVNNLRTSVTYYDVWSFCN